MARLNAMSRMHGAKEMDADDLIHRFRSEKSDMKKTTEHEVEKIRDGAENKRRNDSIYRKYEQSEKTHM